MGNLFRTLTDGEGHAVATAAALAAQQRHHDHGGTFCADMAGVMVLMSYEMTILGPEVIEVSINDSALIPAGYIDAETRKGWAGDIERSRIALGFVS